MRLIGTPFLSRTPRLGDLPSEPTARGGKMQVPSILRDSMRSVLLARSILALNSRHAQLLNSRECSTCA